jgi:transposase
MIYSIVETAKANGLKQQAYLQYLFEQLPQLANPTDPEVLSKLAPCRQLCHSSVVYFRNNLS